MSYLSEFCRTINKAIESLQQRHETHIKRYGRDNERRLTGRHETACVDVYEMIYCFTFLLSI